MGSDLLVSGGEVLGADGALTRADVRVEAGAITAVAPGLDPSGAEVLDARGMIVMPGLVNAHMHSGENFNPGLYENLPLDVWFVHSHQVTRSEPPSREAIYVRTLLGAVLMLRSGTTAAVDFLYEAPEITLDTLEPVVQAYRDAGLRATILLGVADKPYAASLALDDQRSAAAREAPPMALEPIMQLARDAVDRWHEPDGLIGIGLGPSAPQRCTTELLDATLAFARERQLAWQTHVLETKSQAVTSREWHGKSFIEVMDERGQLGPGTTLVHTVWLSDRDIELMTRAGCTAVHCLLSNLRLGDGVARLPALLRAGTRVALGTDGRGCDETLDMFELAKMTALVHKVRGGDYAQWPTARDALRMATAGGSACTGHGERLGWIEEGAHADLVLIPRSSPTFAPLHDPVRQLVYGAPSRDVDTVVVDGRVVVRGGRVLGVDDAWLLDRVAEHAPAVLAGERSDDADELERAVAAMYARLEAGSVDGVDAYLRD
ncbi:MAG: 5-methylthioadenosine/S-adenosylhomocysteine deaminase [Solirubrobacteraceae bacterium]|nr:5-methylthioadenosine/S-adenosylhomocysteine deaminase [Solirubrobacteraceae bacterium]